MTPPPPPRGRLRRWHVIVVEWAFVDPIFITRSTPAAPPPFLRGLRRRRSEQEADGRLREEEQAAYEEARGSEQSVDNGSWLWQEQAVDGATSNYRGRGEEEEDAVTMSAAAARGTSSRRREASRRRLILRHGGGRRQQQATRSGGGRRGGGVV